jgi:hypothetical protein
VTPIGTVSTVAGRQAVAIPSSFKAAKQPMLSLCQKKWG